MLSDSDVEAEADELVDGSAPSALGGLNLTTTTSRTSSLRPRRSSTSGDPPPEAPAPEREQSVDEDADAALEDPPSTSVAAGGAGTADITMEDETGQVVSKVAATTTPGPGRHQSGSMVGPRKTKVVVKDAAWSTWWAILYWVSARAASSRRSRAVSFYRQADRS
jgi:hypothetical protein